jgi:AhpD family alkylhydroperoxidase
MNACRVGLVTPGSRPELAAIEARISAARGRISPLYQVLLNSPAVVQGWEAMLTAIRLNTAVPPRLRELIILRVATLNNAPYEFEAHVPHALAAGMPQALVDALRGAVGTARPGSRRGRSAGVDGRHDARHRGAGRRVRAAARALR